MHIVHLDDAHEVNHIDIVQELEVRVRVHEDKPILEEVILVDDAVIAVMTAVVVITIVWQWLQ